MLLVRWCAVAACGGHAGGLLQCHCQAGCSVATGADGAGNLLQ